MTKTILIVEDEPDLLLVLKVALEIAGYRIVGAATGEEALAVVEQDTPDAIILDLMLPGIDGWTVIEELKARGHFPWIPVLVSSAQASPSTAQRAQELGCHAYIAKPFSVEALRHTLAEILTE